jgi:hypothetical protein
MSAPGLPLDVFLIIDNCAIVGLSEYFGDANEKLAFPDTIQAMCQGISITFNKLRQYALSGKLLTTQLVQDEFKPERSSLAERRDFDKTGCENLKAHVKKEIEVCDIVPKAIETLRSMAQTPSRFGQNLSAFSDPDLSLVVLALGVINHTGRRVYILTDEEDLRSFISWMKPRPEAKGLCPNAHLLEGLHSMIYLDIAHRQCAFTTVQMYEMFTHYQGRQLKRTMLAGTTKGGMVADTYVRIQQAIRESGQIKQNNMAGAA